MAAPAVSESGDALAHQSRIVENVIDKHTTNLIRIFGSDMTYFSGRFIELGFITRDASKHIHGMGSGERGIVTYSISLSLTAVYHPTRSNGSTNLYLCFRLRLPINILLIV